MKNTDEMAERAMRAWADSGSGSPRRLMRVALEAALADVPEPDATVRACDMACRGLEAKLANVRSFLHGWLLGAKAALEDGHLPPERFDELIAALKLADEP